ncbi:MAG: SCP2 sterol-binding domain-containing protein [Acidobacteriota bacterium]
MSYLVFGPDWTAAYAVALAESEAYRKAAQTWEGSIVLEMTAGAAESGSAVFLDLWHGECRAARVASDTDRESADFVIRATIETWKKVLASELDPIFGLMTGKLGLARGKLAQLVPYAAASKELVAAATRLDSVFPTVFPSEESNDGT